MRERKCEARGASVAAECGSPGRSICVNDDFLCAGGSSVARVDARLSRTVLFLFVPATAQELERAILDPESVLLGEIHSKLVFGLNGLRFKPGAIYLWRQGPSGLYPSPPQSHTFAVGVCWRLQCSTFESLLFSLPGRLADLAEYLVRFPMPHLFPDRSVPEGPQPLDDGYESWFALVVLPFSTFFFSLFTLVVCCGLWSVGCELWVMGCGL